MLGWGFVLHQYCIITNFKIILTCILLCSTLSKRICMYEIMWKVVLFVCLGLQMNKVVLAQNYNPPHLSKLNSIFLLLNLSLNINLCPIKIQIKFYIDLFGFKYKIMFDENISQIWCNLVFDSINSINQFRFV